MNGRLTVDHFTTLSIAEHSRLSSLERAYLLITQGLGLSHIRDWKFRVLEIWGDREVRRRGSDWGSRCGDCGCWSQYRLISISARTVFIACRVVLFPTSLNACGQSLSAGDEWVPSALTPLVGAWPCGGLRSYAASRLDGSTGQPANRCNLESFQRTVSWLGRIIVAHTGRAHRWISECTRRKSRLRGPVSESWRTQPQALPRQALLPRRRLLGCLLPRGQSLG